MAFTRYRTEVMARIEALELRGEKNKSHILDLRHDAERDRKETDRLREQLLEAEARIAALNASLSSWRQHFDWTKSSTAAICEHSGHTGNVAWSGPYDSLLCIKAVDYPCYVRFTTGAGSIDLERGEVFLAGETEARMFLDAHPLVVARSGDMGQVSPNFFKRNVPTTCKHENFFCPHRGSGVLDE